MYNPQLERFIRMADAGSFNKAAEQAYITPTAVLKQINLLEADLGVRLFERTHRGLSLTKAGSSLYKDTKYIIQYCKDSVIRAKNAMQENADIIRIGTSPMTPAQVLVELWPQEVLLKPGNLRGIGNLVKAAKFTEIPRIVEENKEKGIGRDGKNPLDDERP